MGVYIHDNKLGLELDMVYVPPGDFIMGTDDADALKDHFAKHTHAMVRGYYIAQKDITVGEFAKFVHSQPGGFKTDAERTGVAWMFHPKTSAWEKIEGLSWHNPGLPQNDDHLVVFVSLRDARAFCEWVGMRLPNEAEWEKAARGERGRRYPWGDDWDSTKANSVDSAAFTSPVNSHPTGASPYGALDMAGNVWQWCLEEFGSESLGIHEDPVTWTSSDLQHRARGGSWLNQPRACRTYHRSWGPSEASESVGHIGFRPVWCKGL